MNLNFDIIEDLKNRILVIDGAMGTNIKNYMLEEEDFRGNLLKNFNVNQKGNNDLLSITKPEVIKSIHRGFLEVGADIIETNTLNSNRISQSNFNLQNLAYDMNYKSAKIAKELCEEFTLKSGKKKYVAGSIGPTNKMLSISDGFKDTLCFNELKNVYMEQIDALIDGGVDLLLIETIIDSLNAEAALIAANEVFRLKNIILPIMISVTIADKSAKLLSGEDIFSFLNSIKDENVISIGLNCSFGIRDLMPVIKELANTKDLFISLYPNAGLPNKFGLYDDSPEIMAHYIEKMIKEGYLNIVGGCCGTTFKHIDEISRVAKRYKPRKIKNI